MKWTRYFLALGLVVGASMASAQTRHVAIANMVDIPQLIQVKTGLVDALRGAGYVEGQNLRLDYLSAQGNAGIATQILRKFVGDAPDVIVTITTPMAQAALSATRTVPVVFTVVTDPLGAKVVPSLKRPGGNATGISDLAPIERQLRLIKAFMPQARRLGVIYNTGLDGSRYQIEVLKPLLKAHGMTLVEANAPTSNEVGSAMRSLVGKTDVVWIPNDPTVYAALESAVRIGQEQKIPVFTAETRTVERGAVASIGFDYNAVGEEAARQVVKILKGAKPGDIDVETPQVFRTVVNQRAAQAAGLRIPDDVARQANIVNR
ncbi:ABC transporter substrate-binding protein [Variovorax sp. DAIF25]|uniref:ABC transporter substrate-binding protein n=1 Tax=Variovorax sp. DAIF25 TaxID=3080983 RepID=UPI003D6AE0ED